MPSDAPVPLGYRARAEGLVRLFLPYRPLPAADVEALIIAVTDDLAAEGAPWHTPNEDPRDPGLGS